jgi:predicted RNA binding protein YcfA (HicA-like mRNA interferase family)
MWRDLDKKRVTVPVHKGKIVPTGTLRSILRDVEISVDDIRKLL